MKNLKMTALVMALSLSSSVAFAEVAVIVHPANGAALSKGSISSIFLGKTKKFSTGSTAVPIALAGASADEFNTKLLGKTSSQLKSYWSKLVFTGKAKPPKSYSENEMIELIKSNENMIGFIDSSAVTADIKVVGKF